MQQKSLIDPNETLFLSHISMRENMQWYKDV